MTMQSPSNGSGSGFGPANPLVGVIGGLGPRASTEFLRRIYEAASWTAEQHAPRVMLLSDPALPDRTDALRSGRTEALEEWLGDRISALLQLGASHVVICCVTIHSLLRRLPEGLQRHVLSLVEVILSTTIERRQKQLLLCTQGVRESGLFEAHRLWREAAPYVVFLDEADQELLHRHLYEIKRGASPDSGLIRRLMLKYGAASWIAGCTELHLTRRAVEQTPGEPFTCIDPLGILAEELGNGNGTFRLFGRVSAEC